jgi:hypothetical protein
MFGVVGKVSDFILQSFDVFQQGVALLVEPLDVSFVVFCRPISELGGAVVAIGIVFGLTQRARWVRALIKS